MANSTEFQYKTKNHTKLAELQVFEPEATKQTRPIDTAALNLLEDPQDTRMYVNELLKGGENSTHDDNL